MSVERGTQSQLIEQINALDFVPALASDLAGATLQRRFDTKFVAHARCVPKLLGLLKPDYRVLRAGDVALARYKTLYFDGSDFASVMAHHRGRRPRQKVRIRHHMDRQKSFLEVKLKSGADRTEKSRLALSFGDEAIGANELEFLRKHQVVEPSKLVPTLRTDFDRITLIGGGGERVTLDVGLSLSGERGADVLSELCIVEVKQARLRSRSPVMLALRACGIRRGRISKYCTAASLLIPELKLARFKPVVRHVRSVTNG